MNYSTPLSFATLGFAFLCTAQAAVIGVISSSESVTVQRVAQLPENKQAAWISYLSASDEQRVKDHAFVASELHVTSLNSPIMPKTGSGHAGMPLDREINWYRTAYALQTAEAIISYQMPNGGWGKNLPMHDHIRKAGESFIGNNISHYLSKDDFDTPKDPYWNYFGTLDNDATTTQLHFLALVISATNPEQNINYKAAFYRGINYLLQSQYPNGGWPQVWPLQGGYHDAITFNDNSVNKAAEVLEGISMGTYPYAFTPSELRAVAATRVAKAITCILECQIKVDGCLTVWCQQHDALTLKPTSARNFEPASQCSDESANVVISLMGLSNPSSSVLVSINQAVSWFKKTAIYNHEWQRRANGGAVGVNLPKGVSQVSGTHFVSKSGAAPIWARYYEIGTDRPIFADRDKTIHDHVEDLSLERQHGYSWYTGRCTEMLDRYDTWKKTH